MNTPLLEVRNLKKYFNMHKGSTAKAVDGVSMAVKEGEILGLVGESGCGKTVTGKMILKLIEPSAGEILFDGRDLSRMSQRAFRPFRKYIQTVFQDPNAALDPKMTIENIMLEPIQLHKIVEPQNAVKEVCRLLESVGLDTGTGKAFPYQLSNGQKQRIAIAKAISTCPRFILCDEPVSALDVSVQSQILNLLMDLRSRLGMAYIFISHSLGVVRHVSDRVGVMYLGRIVEVGSNEDVFERPLHLYTQALLASSPIPDPSSKRDERFVLKGDVPICSEIPAGCAFHPRCPYARDICRAEAPALRVVSDSHTVACHLA